MNRRQFLAAMAGAAVLPAPATSFMRGEAVGAHTVLAVAVLERTEDGAWRTVIKETVRRVRGPDDVS